MDSTLVNLTTIPFAFTKGMVKIPLNFDLAQQEVYRLVMAVFNELCFENHDWSDDQEVQHSFEFRGIDSRSIVEVLTRIDSFLENYNTHLYWSGDIGGGVWRLAVVSRRLRKGLQRAA